MSRQTQANGFSIISILIVILVAAVIALGGWYVWNKNQITKAVGTARPESSVTNEAKTPPEDTTSYTFPIEKMSIAYGKMWKIIDKTQAPNSCGNNDSLTMEDNGLNLNFNFGSICGKGSAPCFEEPGSGCKTESRNLASVNLSSNGKAYILVYRLTADGGMNWDYSVGLTSAPVCNADFCTFTPLNIGSKAGGSTISGRYKADTHSPTSLDEFATLPEVQDAIKVLETAHYSL